MMTFDLHYHLNSKNGSRSELDQLLVAHKNSLEISGVDYVASTEHVYKNALDAYLYLSEAVVDIDTTIIPGVEWIAKEGVEIIFLYESEQALRDALKVLKPFSHSVWDFKKLKDDTGAIAIIPHPFTPGRTGVASSLGVESFVKLLHEADYVEIHNGLSIQINNAAISRLMLKFLPSTAKHVAHTFSLPAEYRFEYIGWSVGSDAHFPDEQYCVGVVDIERSSDWFELLRNRIQFRTIQVRQPGDGRRGLKNNAENIISVAKEALAKASHRRNLPKV